MACYDSDALLQICNNVNLLEYVSQTIPMEKKGDNYFGTCPKHVDKTPSFSIDAENNYYYCFSCNRHGRIIDFLIDFEGLEKDEAIEKAAKLADVDLSTICTSRTLQFLKRVKNIQEKKPKEIIHRELPLTELKKYSKEPVEEWLNEGIEQEVLDLFGVMVDKTQNRIVYPVYTRDGKLINIKARTRLKNYKALKIPKYINYYQIGTMDYLQGLNITEPYIIESNEIIIFESVKSVMKCYGWGYKNCASAEKHTLTDEQIKLIIILGVNVVFAYDSDISYMSGEVKNSIDKLKRITNVFVINDEEELLGGVEAKNSPADCGLEVWEELYQNKKKVT